MVKGSMSIIVKESSNAELWGSSHAELWGSSHAVLRESSSAKAYDFSHLLLYQDSSAEATLRVPVHIFSKNSKCEGGILIPTSEEIAVMLAERKQNTVSPTHKVLRKMVFLKS